MKFDFQVQKELHDDPQGGTQRLFQQLEYVNLTPQLILLLQIATEHALTVCSMLQDCPVP
jgi:hypothetical protein